MELSQDQIKNIAKQLEVEVEEGKLKKKFDFDSRLEELICYELRIDYETHIIKDYEIEEEEIMQENRFQIRSSLPQNVKQWMIRSNLLESITGFIDLCPQKSIKFDGNVFISKQENDDYVNNIIYRINYIIKANSLSIDIKELKDIYGLWWL